MHQFGGCLADARFRLHLLRLPLDDRRLAGCDLAETHRPAMHALNQAAFRQRDQIAANGRLADGERLAQIGDGQAATSVDQFNDPLLPFQCHQIGVLHHSTPVIGPRAMRAVIASTSHGSGQSVPNGQPTRTGLMSSSHHVTPARA